MQTSGSSVVAGLNIVAKNQIPQAEMCTKEEVPAFEFPNLVARLENKLGLTPEEAITLFADTKRFLYLSGTVPGRWGPPEKIDACWHEFILHTEEYAKFCTGYFGRFIHHHPRRPTDPPKDGARPRKTLSAVREIFGKDLSQNWVFPNMKPFLKNENILDEDIFVAGPCDSCGCSPCD